MSQPVRQLVQRQASRRAWRKHCDAGGLPYHERLKRDKQIIRLITPHVDFTNTWEQSFIKSVANQVTWRGFPFTAKQRQKIAQIAPGLYNQVYASDGTFEPASQEGGPCVGDRQSLPKAAPTRAAAEVVQNPDSRGEDPGRAIPDRD